MEIKFYVKSLQFFVQKSGAGMAALVEPLSTSLLSKTEIFLNSAGMLLFTEIRQIIPQIHAEIVKNVVKAWNFVQIKLLSCRTRIDLEAFRKSSPFACMSV